MYILKFQYREIIQDEQQKDQTKQDKTFKYKIQTSNTQFKYINTKLDLSKMSFIRRNSIDKKAPQKQPNLSTLNSTLLSQTLQSQSSQKPSLNPSLILESVKKLTQQLTSIPKQAWQSLVCEQLDAVTQPKKGVLVGQKITLYRQSIQLVTKYQHELKKIGSQLTEKTSLLCINLSKLIFEELNKLTQESKNDDLINQSSIYSSLFDFLQAFAVTAQAEFNNKQKRPLMMRKNSLKKVEQLPAVRPSSKGKLASIVKKQPLLASKKQLLEIRPTSRQEDNAGRTPFEDMIFSVCSILKNLAANPNLRKQLFKQEYLRTINRYLCIWNDKNAQGFGFQLMIQLTACYRHLAVEQKSHKIFLKSNCFDTWTRLIELFPTSHDIVFNMLRILSKLSNYESVCQKLNEKKQCIKTLSSFFKFYKTNIHIIIRIAYIFANMTSYLSDIRNELYFEFGAWQDIFVCFDYYTTLELSGKNEVQKMGLSMAAWDYQAIKKQSDIEAIIKIIRLIANLFTVNEIGRDIYMNDSTSYKELIKKLKGLLQKKSNIQKSSELIACILSCLTNVFFYDRELLMSNPEYKLIKCQLVNVLVDFVVQIDNEEICCEALRVVSNISRMKEFVKIVLQAKIHQAILILLQSTNKEIVYYSLGILINLMIDDQFKQQFKDLIINTVIEILNECQSEDFDLVTVGLKALAVLLETKNQNANPEILAKVETCLMNLGSHCDKIIINKEENNEPAEITTIQESRSLINMLLNNMPEEKFICPIKNCGRKFPDQPKLQDHVKRRHKAA